MKKVFQILSVAVVLAVSVSSCAKCTRCTKSGGSDVKVCEKDYDSNTAYGLAVDFYEATGYDCK